MSNVDKIIYELTNDWDAIVSVLKGNKRIVFINEVEYEFTSDEQLNRLLLHGFVFNLVHR